MSTTKTATARLEAARRNRHQLIDERTLLLSLLTHLYPSHLAPAQTETSDVSQQHLVLCIHTPAGQLAWKLRDDELDAFSHLNTTTGDWDKHTHSMKLDRLRELVSGLCVAAETPKGKER